ncbi:Calx-beta domain-containing protein [Bdellovibrio sp. NC01]|uniref:Calx-beta domain-containing protein n=1 Tax=Bdellovibrio sp. NC01 TaxID=2220073 RepID=UPI001159AEE4|nr:Calx-beta domain-containing protein [Bdellovibrio sp. NC01]QDK37220.1 hypothetical protein DOE51_06260 [Bdellovibrio sp. NC01]
MKLTPSEDGTSLVIDEGSALQITLLVENSDKLNNAVSKLQWHIENANGYFLYSSGVVMIAPGTNSISFPIEVKRNGNVEGDQNFVLTFESSDFVNLEAFKIQLHVRDTTTKALLTASDLNFGAVLKDGNIERTLTVTNSGEATAESIAWDSLTAPFAFKGGSFPGSGGTCANTLAGGESCTMVLTYAPTEPASHNLNFNATYKTPDVDSSKSVQLWGLGVEVAATLGGLPTSNSNISSLNVTVSGTDVTAYKYKLGLQSSTDCSDSADYSSEIAVATHITNALSSYTNQNLRLCVVGKESHNLWQPYNLATHYDWHFDDTPLTLSLNQALTQLDPATNTPVEFTVLFNKPIVPGTFTTAAIQQTGSATGITWSLATSDNVTWSLKATAITGDGTVIPQINAGEVSDVSGNFNQAANSADRSVLYDSIKPTLTINQKAGQADPTNTLPIEFTITFSEVIEPSSFTVADITQSGTATSIVWNLTTSNNKVWSLKATAAGNGTLIPSIAAGVVTDLAGNTNTASTSTDHTVEYNTAAPDNSSNLVWQQSNPANTTALVATWTKSPSAALASQKIQFYSDATCTSATGSLLALSSATTSQSFTGVHGGTYTYKITSIDNASNTVDSSCSDSITIDTQAPTILAVTSSTANGSYKAGDLIDIQMTFSEVVNVTGSPSLALNTTPTNRSAIYTTGSATNTLNFVYTVQATDTSADLEYLSTAALSLGAGTIADLAGNGAAITLPALGGAGSLGGSKNIVIDTTAPTISVFTVTNTTPTNSNIYNLTTTVGGSPTSWCILENSTTVASCAWTAGATLPATFTVTTTNNSKTLYAWVKDLAGNVSAMATSNAVTFDNTPPTATVTGFPTGTSAKYAMNIDVAGTDVITFKYKLGLTASTTCSSATGYSAETNASVNITDNISGLSDGSITLCVVGKDSAGNWQTYASATTKTWTKDSPDIQFTVTTSSISEYDSPTHKVYVSIAAAADIAVSAPYTFTAVGTYPATIGTDFVGTNGTVTIPAGSTSVAISIPINDDIRDEYDETFRMTLGSPTGAYLGANTQHTVTITDDDDPPLVTIQDIFVTEGASSSFRASLSTPTDKGDVSINWSMDTCVGSDCAVQGTDYTTSATSGTAIIPSGDTYVDFGQINTVDNATDEIYRRVPIKLTSATGATLYSSSATVYINDNDFTAGTEVVSIETGSAHTCALTTAKKVYCWGKSNYYQTGLNVKNSIPSPTLVTVATSTTDVTKIKIGYEDTCAITAGGALYCWGMGSHATFGDGILGNGSGASNSIPKIVTGMTSGVTDVGIGYNYMCAIKDGAVYCWGTDQLYTLGKDPNATLKVGNALVPLAVPAPMDSGVSKISAGWNHVCALKTGIMYCWGKNTQGELGQGTQTTGISTPTAVNGIGTVVDFWAGTYGTCAKNSLGDVYCFGNNSDGEILSPVTDAEELPTLLPEFKNASQMSYVYNLCGIVNGNLKCRGRNDYGGLGNNVAGSKTNPVLQQVIGAEANVTYVTGNQEGDTTCFIRSGQAYCTGYGGMGNLGDGYDPAISSPIKGTMFSGANGANVLAIGGYGMCGIFNGGMKCWGDNTYNRVGNLLTDMIYQVPTEVKNSTSNIVSVIINDHGACSLNTSGSVACIGSGNNRGVNSTANSGNPITPTGMSSGVTSIATYSFSEANCAVKSGEAYCWGLNDYGALGTGNKTVQKVPFKITAVGTDVIQIAPGAYHTCILKSDGTVWCAGFNGSGQLGQNDNVERLTHTQVSGITTAVAIASTGSGTCALLANNTVTCWGTSHGSGSGAKLVPTAVSGLTNVTSLKGNNWNYCVTDSGSLKCWGDNVYGQMGVGSLATTTYYTPIAPSGFAALGAYSDISIGSSKIFIKVGTDWYGAGLDDYGQFGRAAKSFRLAPVSVLPIPN